MMLNNLLDRKAVAARLGVSTKTIDRWRATGHLPQPVFSPGRKRYWSVRQIDLVDKMRHSRTLKQM